MNEPDVSKDLIQRMAKWNYENLAPEGLGTLTHFISQASVPETIALEGLEPDVLEKWANDLRDRVSVFANTQDHEYFCGEISVVRKTDNKFYGLMTVWSGHELTPDQAKFSGVMHRALSGKNDADTDTWDKYVSTIREACGDDLELFAFAQKTLADRGVDRETYENAIKEDKGMKPPETPHERLMQEHATGDKEVVILDPEWRPGEEVQKSNLSGLHIIADARPPETNE